MRARVTTTHRAPNRPPLRLRRDDPVLLADRDDAWPQFVWTQLGTVGGRVPAALFDAERGSATALEAYDTTELDVDPGRIVTLHRELADWWRVEDAVGAQGWVPSRLLQIPD